MSSFDSIPVVKPNKVESEAMSVFAKGLYKISMFMRVWNIKPSFYCINGISDKFLNTVRRGGVKMGHDNKWDFCFNSLQSKPG